jgi:tetraprenyl-beta-curcumene synthase
VTVPGRDSLAVLAALGTYRGRVLPIVGRELTRWRDTAAAIPDPELRRMAVAALEEKGSNVEATAVFATLAPAATRARAIRAMVALQVAVDYLDSLGEDPGPDPLADGLELHAALADALDPNGGARRRDWYAVHPRGEDGGYLGGLAAACREEVVGLPAFGAVGETARRAAKRCGEGQGRTHAAGALGRPQLEDWARSLDAPTSYRWWEIAAGASSSVAAHALIAAAADRRSTVTAAEAIDAAHFPAVGALTVLLDDLRDLERDEAEGDHNYIRYYANPEEAATRIGLIAELARGATRRLRRPGRHAAIADGVLAYYLAVLPEDAAGARAVRERILAAAGPGVGPISAFLRTRRGRSD